MAGVLWGTMTRHPSSAGTSAQSIPMTSSWGGEPLSKQTNSLASASEALFFMSDTQSGVTSPKEIFKGNTDKDENPSLCKWCWYNMQCTGLATALCKCHPVQGSRLQYCCRCWGQQDLLLRPLCCLLLQLGACPGQLQGGCRHMRQEGRLHGQVGGLAWAAPSERGMVHGAAAVDAPVLLAQLLAQLALSSLITCMPCHPGTIPGIDIPGVSCMTL
jgi:hypothetical protein